MALIVSPITNHANRNHSHRTAWGRMWSECLGSKLCFNSDWSNESVVYFEHGMEFNEKSRGVNVFLKEEKSWDKLAEKAEMFCNFSGKAYSLDIDCPDYGERLKSRVRPHSSNKFKSLDFEKISRLCNSAKTITQDCLDRNGLVLGDSHALAAWRTDAFLSRNDGKTLNGAINAGFDHWQQSFTRYKKLNFLRTCFGNIDIRHHICRLENTTAAQERVTVELVDRYFKELSRIKQLFDIQVIEVVAALPIEDESRKLPKTGYYLKKPFWGSWDERNNAHTVFNDRASDLCAKLGYKLIEWPKHFYNEENKLSFDYMERPRSVHVSPVNYMWKAINE